MSDAYICTCSCVRLLLLGDLMIRNLSHLGNLGQLLAGCCISTIHTDMKCADNTKFNPIADVLLVQARVYDAISRICIESITIAEINNYFDLAAGLILTISPFRVGVGSCNPITDRTLGFIVCNALVRQMKESAMSFHVSTLKLLMENIGITARLLPVCSIVEMEMGLNFLSSSIKVVSIDKECSAVGHTVHNLNVMAISWSLVANTDKETISNRSSIPNCSLFMIDLGAATETLSVWQLNVLAEGFRKSNQDLSVSPMSIDQYCQLATDIERVCQPTHLLRHIINPTGSHSHSSRSFDRAAIEELVPQVLCQWSCRAEEGFTGRSACRCSNGTPLQSLTVDQCVQLAWESVLVIAVLTGLSSQSSLTRCLQLVCQIHDCRCILRHCHQSMYGGSRGSSPIKSPSRGSKRSRPGGETVGAPSPEELTLRQIEAYLTGLKERLSSGDVCLSITELLSRKAVLGADKEVEVDHQILCTDAGLALVSVLCEKLQLGSDNKFGADVVDVVDKLVLCVPSLLKSITEARNSESREVAYGEEGDSLCQDCASKIRMGSLGLEIGIRSLCGRSLRLCGLKILLLLIVLLCSRPDYIASSEHRKQAVKKTLVAVLQSQLDVVTSTFSGQVLMSIVKSDTIPDFTELKGFFWRLWSSNYAASDRTALYFNGALCGLDPTLSLLLTELRSTSPRDNVIALLRQHHCSDLIVKLVAGSVPGQLNGLSVHQHCLDVLWYLFWNSINNSQRLYTAAFVMRSVLSGMSIKNKSEIAMSPAREVTKQRLLQVEEVPLIQCMRGKRAALRESAIVDKLEYLARSNSSNLNSAMEVILDENSNNSFAQDNEKPKTRRSKKMVFRPLQSVESHCYYLLKMVSGLPALVVASSDATGSGLIDICGLIIWTGKALSKVIQEELSTTGVYKDFLIQLIGGRFIDSVDWCTVMGALLDSLNEVLSDRKSSASALLLSWMLTSFMAMSELCGLIRDVLCPSFLDDLSEVAGKMPPLLKSAENGVRRLKSLAIKRNLKIMPVAEGSAVVEEGSDVRWNDDFSRRMNEFVDECEKL